MPYEAIVIGVSAGGLQALKTILPALPQSFSLPIAIVQHVGERTDDFMAQYLNNISAINIKEADDKEPLQSGYAYLAPPGYHLLIENDRYFSLSVDQRVNYSCPSIDVLFESAADAYKESLIGIILTGANSDGANGLKTIKEHGGLTIVQLPEEAESDAMPRAAIEAANVDYILGLKNIVALLIELSLENNGENYATAG